LFPFWTQAPNGEFASHVHGRAWVPLDDEHTMFCFLWWKRGTSAMTLPQPAFKDGTPIRGTGRGNKFLPNTTDWLGRWRLAAKTSNDWGMNRAAQRNNAIYSGIDGIHLQDQAITESMGPIVDHTFEHLAPSDRMITQTRRRLLMAARSLHDRGVLPPGVEDADVSSSVTTRLPGRRSMPGNWPHHCVRRRPRCDGQRHTFGTEAGLNVTKSRSGLLLS
jgi:phthalate 4,5-dioxygenase